MTTPSHPDPARATPTPARRRARPAEPAWGHAHAPYTDRARHGRATGTHGASPWTLEGAYATLADLARLRIPHAPSPAARSRAPHHGERTSPIRGRGMDFDEVRLYQPGDDVRSIDWRVTARKGKPHTKVFREERERPTLIAVDQSRSMFFGSRERLKSVLAAEIAARIAWGALAAQDRVGGLVLANSGVEVFKPLRRKSAVLRLLAGVAAANNTLAQDQGTTGDAWSRLVAPLLRLAHGNHRVVIVSDFLDAPDRDTSDHAGLDALVGMARHNEVELLFVHDPLEGRLPPTQRYRVTDGVRRHTFHTRSAALRHAYAERFDTRRDAVEHAASVAGMGFAAVATSEASWEP